MKFGKYLSQRKILEYTDILNWKTHVILPNKKWNTQQSLTVKILSKHHFI